MTCTYPDLGNWAGRKPVESEDAAVELAEARAWFSMLMLAGGRVAACPCTVRPVSQAAATGTYLSAPVGGGGATGGVASDYGAAGVELDAPVGKVVSVEIDGVTVDPSAYRLSGTTLIRHDGDVWPTTQDLTLEAGEVGTWSVTYYQGYVPDANFVYATGILASEFYKDIAGDKKCRLPERVTAVTRQGVSFEMPADVFGDGRTGIREVDTVLRVYNPNALKSAPLILSPESLRRRPRY